MYGIANYPFIEFKLQKLNLSLIKTEKYLKIIFMGALEHILEFHSYNSS